MGTFEKELLEEKKRFLKLLPELRKEHEGKWVLFKGGEAKSFYDTKEEAYKNGLTLFGRNTPFLVELIAEQRLHTGSFALEIGLLYTAD